MTAIVPLMEAVARRELEGHRTLSLGVVTEVFTNSGGDGAHHLDAHVRLHGGDLVLQNVPVLTGRAGVSAAPRADDLVVVGFLDGDVNGAVVLGVVHAAGVAPPQAEPDEVVYEVPDPEADVRRLELRLPNGNLVTVKDTEVRITMGGTTVLVEADGNIALESAADITLKASGNLQLEATGNLELKAQGNASMKAPAVDVEAQGAAKLKGATTTIAGICSFSAG